MVTPNIRLSIIFLLASVNRADTTLTSISIVVQRPSVPWRGVDTCKGVRHFRGLDCHVPTGAICEFAPVASTSRSAAQSGL